MSGLMLDAFRRARADLEAMLGDSALMARAGAVPAMMGERLKRGQKIMACGNGGSACDAAHFAEELTGRFRNDRPPLAALACTDAGHITCTANDFGFEEVFARWVTALARPGDVVVVLSTSGNSENIVRAAAAAKGAGATTVGLLGRGGGRLKGACEHEIIVPGEGSDRIQELHMLVMHAWVEEIERGMGFGV